MSFYQTPMGRAFFEHHVPQLIQAIQALTAAMSKQRQAAVLPVEADPDFLSELYFGNYEPGIFKQTSEESKKAIHAVNEAHAALVEVLPDECCDALENYLDEMAERNAADMRRAYESGFRTAVQMMVAGLSRPDCGQADDAA